MEVTLAFQNPPASLDFKIFSLKRSDIYGVVRQLLFNTYSMKQPDLSYFETIKMTSQTLSNFVWRIRAAGEYSL